MGEAKRRHDLAVTSLSPSDPRLAEAARIMQLITLQLVHDGREDGFCIAQSIVGGYVLHRLGIPSVIRFGSLLYRVGPDRQRDVLRFCSFNNAGAYRKGSYLYHSWLCAGGCLIDFSTGGFQVAALRARPNLQWAIPKPPTHWIKSEVAVTQAWQPHGAPSLGEVWYGPFQDPEGLRTLTTLIDKQTALFRNALAIVVDDVRQTGLPFTFEMHPLDA
jgi:hypothetical protein